jgi:hypothetical protein
MKKLMSLFMAGVMILALAVPAFAEDYFQPESSESDALTQTLTFAARTFVPTVKLTLPALTGDPMVLNPYKIDFDSTVLDTNTLNGVGVGNANDKIKQVISPVYAIKNETDVKLNFAFSVTATTEGEISLSNDPISITETNKKAHIIFAVEKNGFTPSSGTGAIATTGEQTIDAYDTSKCEYVTLKATGEAKSSNDQEKSLAPGSTTANYLRFQFQGDMARKTTKAWADSDKVTAVVTFTFTPESRQDFTATHDDSTNVINATATAFADKTIQLAVGDTTAAAFASTVAPTGATFHATPEWAVVSSGGLGTLTVNASNQLVVSKDAQKLVPNDSTAHDYKIVLSYKDKNSIPRTLELTLKLLRTDS